MLASIFKNGYFPGINRLYKSLSENCLEMEFCIDGSRDKKLLLLNYNIDLYSDYRHPNAYGNEIIAEYILKKIIDKL